MRMGKTFACQHCRTCQPPASVHEKQSGENEACGLKERVIRSLCIRWFCFGSLYRMYPALQVMRITEIEGIASSGGMFPGEILDWCWCTLCDM